MVLFLRDSTLMIIYHRHIFVLYIIHQNDPVSKSLRCIIPWFLCNRSYRRRAPRYRRHAPSYRRHPIKLPSSVISVNFAYRRLAANLSGIIVQKREKVPVCRFGARCTMLLCFPVVNLREIGGRKEARTGKNFSKRAAAPAPSWRRWLRAVAPSVKSSKLFITNLAAIFNLGKLQGNFDRNSNIFIRENVLENVVCEMVSFCLGPSVFSIIRYIAPRCWGPSLYLSRMQMTPATSTHRGNRMIYYSAHSDIIEIVKFVVGTCRTSREWAEGVNASWGPHEGIRGVQRRNLENIKSMIWQQEGNWQLVLTLTPRLV